MSSAARSLSLVFAAGAVGGLANSLALHGAVESGVVAALGVRNSPELTAAWLYPRLVWGGVFGLLFLLPLAAGRWLAQGLWLSLGPSLVQLCVIFPYHSGAGWFGQRLGALTPFVVLAANAVWGLAAAAWLRATGR